MIVLNTIKTEKEGEGMGMNQRKCFEILKIGELS
jgi:hypothetical protein